MSSLQIQTDSDNPILRTKSKKITEITRSHKILITKMKKSVGEERGLGLAAPQVGKNIRLVILNISKKIIENHTENNEEKETLIPEVLINPEIIRFSKDESIMEEGCLSLPGIFGYVKRPKEIELVYRDENFKKIKIKASGILARVTQHEIDHLDGILFVDRLMK